MAAVLVMFFVVLVACISVLLTLRRFVLICGPNEALVLTGRRQRIGGIVVGYRVVQGRVLRIPFVEQAHRLDLTSILIPLEFRGRTSEPDVELHVEGAANVKIPFDPPVMNNAIERFLGRPREEISRAAEETLASHLAAVLANTTAEDATQDRLALVDSVIQSSAHDLERLGLVVDTLALQKVVPTGHERLVGETGAEQADLGVELSFPRLDDPLGLERSATLEGVRGTLALSFSTGASADEEAIEAIGATEVSGTLFGQPATWVRWSTRTGDLKKQHHLQAAAPFPPTESTRLRIHIRATDEGQLDTLRSIAESIRASSTADWPRPER